MRIVRTRDRRNAVSDRLARLAFAASASFLLILAVFACGLAVGHYQIWPFSIIQGMKNLATSYLKYGEFVPENRRHIAAPDAPRVPFAIYAPELRAGGHYVFLGWNQDAGTYSAWLYDAHGTRLHTWFVDYATLDPDGPSNGADNPHAFHVLADGSLVVGFDKGDVMARLDSCSSPAWIRPGIFHHAMEPAEDGSIWTWHAEGTAYGHYHELENFDPRTGERIKGVALVEDIIRNSDPTQNIFGVRPDYPFRKLDRDPEEKSEIDILHPNDIEELSIELSPQFPMFEAGDLLLSFRTIHLVSVVAPDTFRIKWWSHGPWMFQHDPDFRSDGKISVYSNNSERARSEILNIDPRTRAVSNDLYGANFAFYSEFRGRHQYLSNGNVLIVVPEEGRVVELTSDGRKVLEFNNISPAGEEYNEDVENALWLEPGYLAQIPACRK
jgi:Arylsulfotransferase (ASST)